MVYVLDEFFVGLYLVDIEVLLCVLVWLKVGGNLVFVVEYELEVICVVDWVIDIGFGVGV